MPILLFDPPTQRALSRELNEGASDERILHLLSQATGQSYWITLLQRDPILRDLERSSEVKDFETCWRLLAAWSEAKPTWLPDARREADRDPYAKWLVIWTEAVLALREARGIPAATSRFAALQSWKTDLFSGQKARIDPALGSPRFAATAKLGALGGLLTGPLGSAAAEAGAFLAARASRNALFHRRSGVADQSRIQTLTTLPITLANVEMNGLLERVQVDLTVRPPTIPAGQDSEIELRLKNRSPLALRSIGLRAGPGLSESSISFLDPDQESGWTVPIRIPKPGKLTIEVEWSATRLDDSKVAGHLQVSIDVTEFGAEIPDLKPLETSPYVVATPIDSECPEMFFGREDILARIRRSLRPQGPSTVLLLEGVRRSGKTSILKQLVEVQPPPGWIPAYWSSQSGDGKQQETGISADQLFYGISREFILAAHAAGVSFKIPVLGTVTEDTDHSDLRFALYERLKPAFRDGGGFELLDIVVETLVKSAASKRFLLILDEFDKIQEGIRSGVTSPQVPENIRYLFHTHSALSGIISGSPEIKRLREQYWGALFGIGNVIRVSGLDTESARRLVVEPADRLLVYTPSAIELILTLCACQPYLIQLLCGEIFEQAAVTGNHSVTVSTVESAAISDTIVKNEQLRFQWQSIGNDLRSYIVCLIDRLSRGNERVTLDLIIERLEEDSLIDDGQLVGTEMQELLDFEIVSLKQDELGNSYHITVPLFSYWIRRNVDERINREAILNGRSTRR